MRKHEFYKKYIKRLLDIIFALLFLILFCWLYAIIALLVRIKMGSPVIFRQQRPGMIDKKTGKEKIFELYKFRSMLKDQFDANGEIIPDDKRLTKFGKWLRSTSLDELPEMVNILKGEMSLVGPRPLLVRYLPYYTTEERHRHDVRPGLTGMAQINGRNLLKWEDRFSKDVFYSKNISFFMDVYIIFKTIGKVFRREDIAVGSEQVLMDLDTERKEIRGNGD